MIIKKILVPYDFSKVAKNAFNFACELGKETDHSDIVLLNVIEHPTADSFRTMGMQDIDPMEQLYIKRLIETTRKKLETVIEEANYPNDKLFHKIQMGNVSVTIVDEITEESAELLIVGTEGADGLNEFFVGSNAEKIVRKAHCPVITIREPSNVRNINNIVFASDFSTKDDVLMNHLLGLQSGINATMHIVKINTPASFTSTRHDKKQMEDFVNYYGIQNYTIDIYNARNEEDGIMNYAEDIGAQMIALGTHQRRGLDHFFSYSISQDVVNNSKIPVWTSHIKS